MATTRTQESTATPALHVRLQPDLKAQVESAAERMGLTTSVYIRLVLAERLGLKLKAATMGRVAK